jgi:hypothetical protein
MIRCYRISELAIAPSSRSRTSGHALGSLPGCSVPGSELPEYSFGAINGFQRFNPGTLQCCEGFAWDRQGLQSEFSLRLQNFLSRPDVCVHGIISGQISGSDCFRSVSRLLPNPAASDG